VSDHITWRVYCRGGADCEVLPRLSRKAAVQTATEHAEETGHWCEVVRLQYDVKDRIYPSADAIGRGAEIPRP
jgi:hypothetical protein